MRRTRQEKFPDTAVFHFYNANPKNRITGDCAIRAICTALNRPYNDVVMEMAELQCETGYDAYGLIDRYMKLNGWTKHPQPKKADGTKLTGYEFCKYIQTNGRHIELQNYIYPSKRILVNIGSHHIVAVVEGKVHDIWNPTKKCVGNYWTKD